LKISSIMFNDYSIFLDHPRLAKMGIKFPYG
jgi:hypothetical protein